MANEALLREIAAFCKRHNMAETAFGREALKGAKGEGDWRLIKELRGETKRGQPRRLWPETVGQIHAFMAREDARLAAKQSAERAAA